MSRYYFEDGKVLMGETTPWWRRILNFVVGPWWGESREWRPMADRRKAPR